MKSPLGLVPWPLCYNRPTTFPNHRRPPRHQKDMALDLTQTVDQIDRMAHFQARTGDDRNQRLAEALRSMTEASPDELSRKVEANRTRPFLCAGVKSGFSERIPAPQPPTDCTVASVDGSHVDVDRHLPVRCYLINIGGCLLTYGSESDAELFSKPRLHFGDDDLYMTSPDPNVRDTVAVEGQLLGLKTHRRRGLRPGRSGGRLLHKFTDPGPRRRVPDNVGPRRKRPPAFRQRPHHCGGTAARPGTDEALGGPSPGRGCLYQPSPDHRGGQRTAPLDMPV